MSLEIITLIKTVLAEHEEYWDQQRGDMVRYDNVYQNRFWADQAWDQNSIRVECPEGYALIEGYVSSLFPKAPSISVVEDALNNTGNADAVKALCDRFLYEVAPQIEQAIRQALIYTHSILKVADSPNSNASMVDGVEVRALPPWEVLFDRSANSWDTQRWVGHVYYIPVSEAREKYGKDKNFKPVPKVDFLAKQERRNTNDFKLPEEYLYIKVVEFYDLVKGDLHFWTPDWENGRNLLDSGPIALDTHSGMPLPPLVPLFFVRKPSAPLEGMSTIGRSYDQIAEKNIVRSFWANAIRRDTRQWLYREGTLEPEEIAKVVVGQDGGFIAVTGDSEVPLDRILHAVPSEPISANHDRYLGFIEDDLQKGTIMAPFSRGEGTKGATATEVRALYAYSASEIGRLAREKDTAINRLAEVYTRYLNLHLADTDSKEVLMLGSVPTPLTDDLFAGKFRYQAVDQASTPILDSMKQNMLISLLPVFKEMGVGQQELRAKIVKVFNEITEPEWVENPDAAAAAEAPPPTQAPLQAPGGMPGMPGELPGGLPFDGTDEVRMARDGLPAVPDMII